MFRSSSWLRRLFSLAFVPALACTAPTAQKAAPPPVALPARPPAAAAEPEAPQPPIAKRTPHPQTVHGTVLQDDWYWLREKDSPDVLDYLRRENAYTDALAKPGEALRARLYDEMLARVQQADDTPPYLDHGYLYYTRTETGKQYQIICRKKGSPAAPEQVILDQNALAEGKKFLGISRWRVSDDGQLLAYAVDETGFRQYELRIKDLTVNAPGLEHIPRVTSFAWAADNKTLFYVQEDPVAKRAFQLFRHRLGSGQDELVLEEKDERFSLEVRRSSDRELIFVSSGSHTQTEERWLPAAKPGAAPRLIEARSPEHEYSCDHRGSELFCLTNSGGRNFRMIVTALPAARVSAGRELIPHRPAVFLADFQLFRDFAVIEEREDGLPHLRVLDLKSGGGLAGSHRIEMPETAYDVSGGINREFDATTYRFEYESPITPPSVFEYQVAGRKRLLLKEKPVPGGYDRTRYAVERLHARAEDGAEIPITLVHLRGAPQDGKGALHLLGYGAYGLSYPEFFSSECFSLIDRGVAEAVAHIRGGGELGKAWHDQGRMLNKRNTFTDFIAAAGFLVQQGFTSRDRLAIEGGSAGGLLMGAVLNLRPDVAKAALLEVPFVDLMNTMLDKSLPLTVSEFEEWGNPGGNEEQFRYMLSYSPYDNIAPREYPDLLVRTSYNDSQVMYWEPAKYVARLRATKTDHNPLLFKINMDPAGHGGASGRFDKLRDRAFDYAWLLREVGIEQ